MIWKRYPNETMILISFLFMFVALMYKSSAVDRVDVASSQTKDSISHIGEIIALKKQWGDDKQEQKIDKIKQAIPKDKIKLFSTRGKKFNAEFEELSSAQVNSVILKLQNIAVQIIKLDIKSKNGNYSMEIKCKW